MWLRQNPDIPTPRAEFEFHPTRKWRFDFAWPDHMVALEIEGVTPDGGRHQTIGGFLGDAEKYEAALRLGWTVYRVPGPWIASKRRVIWREEVLDVLRIVLARAAERGGLECSTLVTRKDA